MAPITTKSCPLYYLEPATNGSTKIAGVYKIKTSVEPSSIKTFLWSLLMKLTIA